MIPIQILEGIIGRSLIWNAILGFFATLDRIAYTIFGWVMQAVFDIANAEIINSSVYDDFQKRVYVILGIFMLFKVTISLLTYLVSPDKINDKERGMAKMVTRTIVVICMLAGLPFAFNLLDKAQPILLEALPRIIIGKNTSTSTTTNQMGGIADTISWTTFQLSLNEETVNLMMEDDINTVEGATSVITEPATDNSKYKYFYIPVVGTVIAVIMTFLMVGFCIDIAIRSFKLIILRMIAPIPIISYIDPKAAKDGAFSNWTKSLISTWLDLFIRLGILYFVLYIIDAVILSWNFNLGNIGFFRNAVVVLFLIIGLLFFARQAPKFISDALGIKNSKGLGVGLGGMLAAGGALLGGAGLAGAAMAGMTAMNENADAAAQGKAGTASWSKGRDLATQLRTGDKNAKGGITNSLQRSASKMQGERMAKKYGLSENNVKLGKDQMISAQKNASLASQAYSAAIQGHWNTNASGEIVDAFGNKLKNQGRDQDSLQELSESAAAATAYSQKVSSDYQSASSARDALVGKDSPYAKYKASFRNFKQDEQGRLSRQSQINNYNTSHTDYKKIEPGLEKEKGTYKDPSNPKIKEFIDSYEDNKQPYDPLK